MSIRTQIEDARVLRQNGKHTGALTMLLLAVAASARKTFPKGTKSERFPKKLMGDQEIFTLFLGGRIRKILFGDYSGPEEGPSSFVFFFRGEGFQIEDILYKFFRCELVHEGELPPDVEFNSSDKEDGNLSTSNIGNKIVLGYGWLNLLERAVVMARCNGSEFFIDHYVLHAFPGIDDYSYLLNIANKFHVGIMYVCILKQAVLLLDPDRILKAGNPAVIRAFEKLISSMDMRSAAFDHLRNCSNILKGNLIQGDGIEILKCISTNYFRVKFQEN